MQSSKETPPKAVHGGLRLGELRQLGLTAEEVVDFSASINPLGPPPCVWEAMARVDISVYPDPDCLALREALSATLGVIPESVTIGNGSTELIYLLGRACLSAGDEAFIFAPTFGEYEAACHLTDATITFLHAHESNGFLWDVDYACQLISEKRPRLAFLCNPNNPTGVYLGRSDVLRLANTVDSGLLVIDEAYIAFVDGAWDFLELLELGNVVLIRSMTKDYALTGLRLGYCVASEGVSRLLRVYQPSWSVNSLAQAAGLAALSDGDHLDAARECVSQGKAYLRRELEALGLKVAPSAANFLLVDVGDAAGVRAGLLRRGLCVRDCTSFGLPRHIRVGIRTLPDCQRLVQELREVILPSPPTPLPVGEGSKG